MSAEPLERSRASRGFLVVAALTVVGLVLAQQPFVGLFRPAPPLVWSAQVAEHALQLGSPLLPWLAPRLRSRVAQLLVALTFAGHGVFALALGPTPAHWYLLVERSLALSEPAARYVLFAAGVADFAVALVLVVDLVFPLPTLRRIALSHACFWGSATALARSWAFFELATPLVALQFAPETLRRSGHGLVPWLLLNEREPAPSHPLGQLAAGPPPVFPSVFRD